jgi:hypothetical protein
MRGHGRLRSDAHRLVRLVRGRCLVRARRHRAGTSPTGPGRIHPGRPSPCRSRRGCPRRGSSRHGRSRRGQNRRPNFRRLGQNRRRNPCPLGRSPDPSRGRRPSPDACRHRGLTGRARTRRHSRRPISRVSPHSRRGRHRPRVMRQSPCRRLRTHRPRKHCPRHRRTPSRGLGSHRRGLLGHRSGRNRPGVRSRRPYRRYRPGVRARSQRRHAEMRCRLRPLSPTS